MATSVVSPDISTPPADWTLTLKTSLIKLATSSSPFEHYPGTPIYEARKSQLARIEHGWRAVLLSYAKEDLIDGITGVRRKKYWTECECLIAYELNEVPSSNPSADSENFFNTFVKHANYIPCPQFLTGISVEEIAENAAPESRTMATKGSIGEVQSRYTPPAEDVPGLIEDVPTPVGVRGRSPAMETAPTVFEPSPSVDEANIIVPNDIPIPTSPLSRGIEILPTAFSYPGEKASPKKLAPKTKPKAKRPVTPSKISSWNVNVVGAAQEPHSPSSELGFPLSPSPSTPDVVVNNVDGGKMALATHDVEDAQSGTIASQSPSLSSRLIRAFSLLSFVGSLGFLPTRFFLNSALRAMTFIGIRRR